MSHLLGVARPRSANGNVSHTFMEIDHEIISTAILFPLIQEGLSVTSNIISIKILISFHTVSPCYIYNGTVKTFDLHLAIIGLENQFSFFLRVAVFKQGLLYEQTV